MNLKHLAKLGYTLYTTLYKQIANTMKKQHRQTKQVMYKILTLASLLPCIYCYKCTVRTGFARIIVMWFDIIVYRTKIFNVDLNLCNIFLPVQQKGQAVVVSGSSRVPPETTYPHGESSYPAGESTYPPGESTNPPRERTYLPGERTYPPGPQIELSSPSKSLKKVHVNYQLLLV